MTGLEHFNEALTLQNNMLKRFSKIVTNSISLISREPDPNRLTELNELNDAFKKRVEDLQGSWAEEWQEWYAFANSLSGAKTFPKFAERYSNIGLQAQEQLAKQLTDLSELFENTSISYSFWLSKQVNQDDI